MRTIDLDATTWQNPADFYHALGSALGVPDWHGYGLNAFLDTMVWHEGINAVQPPYTIRVRNFDTLSEDIREQIKLLQQTLSIDQADYNARYNRNLDIHLEIVS
jgi:RNAse (barnase) inhibitor barstar